MINVKFEAYVSDLQFKEANTTKKNEYIIFKAYHEVDKRVVCVCFDAKIVEFFSKELNNIKGMKFEISGLLKIDTKKIGVGIFQNNIIIHATNIKLVV